MGETEQMAEMAAARDRERQRAFYADQNVKRMRPVSDKQRFVVEYQDPDEVGHSYEVVRAVTATEARRDFEAHHVYSKVVFVLTAVED